MAIRTLKLIRGVLGVVWLALVIGLLGLSAVTHLAGLFDSQVFIVRGASMAPAIPQGALIIVAEARPEQIQVGDVVTVRTDDGAIITHRVIDLRQPASGPLMLRTQGDASTVADATLFPASAVIGEVQAYAPHLGFVLAFLSMPSGLVSVLSALGALLLTRWMLEDTISSRRRPARSHVPQPMPSGG